MITYLILANIFMVICYGFYHVFLRRETFFQCNRLFLLSGLLLSFLLPLIDMSATLGKANPIYHVYLPAVQIGVFAPEQASGAVADGAIIATASARDWFGWVYWIGCIVAGITFLYKLAMTIRVLRSGAGQQGFSFFGKVHVDKTDRAYDEIETHENVHSRQWHSLDVVLIEIIKVFNWFNPIVYLYARALKLQHEYIADRETAVNKPVRYAKILMSAALGVSRPLLTTPFAESRYLKKRIQMLLKTKSRQVSLAKFALFPPLVLAMLTISMAFSGDAFSVSQESDEQIRTFREQIGRNTQYPKEAVNDLVVGDVIVLFDKQGDDYETLGFLSNSSQILSASVKQTMERDNIKALAPGGKNALKVSFRIMSDRNIAEPRPPLQPEKPSGYRQLDDVTIVSYDSPDAYTLTEDERNVLFESVEVSPEPPGGMHAFRHWIGQNYVFPQAAVDAGVNGTIEVSFVVEVDGSLTDIRVLHDLKHGTGEEAVRLLKSSSEWQPGIQNGRPVRVAYTLPIRIATQ